MNNQRFSKLYVPCISDVRCKEIKVTQESNILIFQKHPTYFSSKMCGDNCLKRPLLND